MAHRADNILRHLAPEECKAHELSGSSIHLKSNRDQAVIDRSKLKQLLAKEEKMFLDSHPKSRELFERAKKCLLGGVPMPWQVRWAGKFPIFVTQGEGQYFWDVDGHKYLDLCLGDTGSMCGHAPKESMDAIVDQLRKGTTFMLPSEDALAVGEELQKRFGLPYWQLALTATDANRFCIRLARTVTGRRKVLAFNWCYHGTVDETFAVYNPATGKTTPRPGNTGYGVDPSLTTRICEFNDLAALERELSHRDVAVVLAEPAMTNIGIIHPNPGYWEKAQELCKRYGSLLIIDETHTICAGPGGYTKEYNLKPDMLVIGKTIASGIPAAVYGVSSGLADQILKMVDSDSVDTSGIGGTLAGNVLSLRAIRATLQNTLSKETFARTVPLSTRFTEGVQQIIDKYNLPWSITQLGNRAEYWFCPTRPINGHEAVTHSDVELDRYMHLFALNRGILMTPFHMMALIAPTTTEADIDHHTKVFHDAVKSLLM